jgi:hypothetical protein
MSTLNQKYNVGKTMQLIDLNREATNFELSFKATSTNNEPFFMVVTDQSTLDDGTPLDFKNVNGTINGTIRNDKNIYQNYLLVLKADTPCEVTIDIDFDQLPDNIPQPQQEVATKEKDGYNIPWRKIICVVVLIAGCALLYYFYRSKSKTITTDTVNELSTTPSNPLYTQSTIPSNPYSTPSVIRSNQPYSTPSRTTFNPQYTSSDDVFSKLQNLPIR